MVNLSKSGDTIQFTFSSCPHYLNDGTISVPLNSLTLVTDESDMVTFRKSASNDIFVSTLISEFGMSKAQLIQWFKENMVGGGGGGVTEEEVQEMIDEATESYINDASYDSSTKHLNLLHDDEVITYVDTTDIIDPSDYYTKAQVDTALSGKVDSSEFDVKEEVIASALTSLHDSVSALTADIQTITDETLDGLSLKQVTQAEYDAMSQAGTLDESTLYVIVTN